MSRYSFLLLLPFLAGTSSCPPEPSLAWYVTCGDPVCGGYTGPTEGVPLCTDEAEGDACSDEGATCDPEDDCNALIVCATEDPTAQPGGCPISRRKYKRDIHYLSAAERAAVADTAVGMKLATWSYRREPAGTPPHLGFIIDDNEGSYAVTADGDHVDLYGYTSLALAASQAQERRLAEQQARIDAQEQRILALEARLAALVPDRTLATGRGH
jgi:hypothetical protein